MPISDKPDYMFVLGPLVSENEIKIGCSLYVYDPSVLAAIMAIRCDYWGFSYSGNKGYFSISPLWADRLGIYEDIYNTLVNLCGGDGYHVTSFHYADPGK